MKTIENKRDINENIVVNLNAAQLAVAIIAVGKASITLNLMGKSQMKN